MPMNSKFPDDPYEVKRLEILSRMKATRPSQPDFTLKKFLENDRRVLRFYCVWDDSSSLFGDLRKMVVNYFLSDDTIEIREQIPANSGRGSNTLFLRRCKLPKDPYRTRKLEKSQEFFSDRDFMIGSVIHLYGRPFVICDCDDFTKIYYNENYGVHDFNPVCIEDYEEEPVLVPFFAGPTVAEEPQLNIGGDTHSKKDFKKLVQYDGVILRYLAVLDTTEKLDKERKFVICLHLADDTITVFEPPQRNSGVVGGKFLEQRRQKKPSSDKYYTSVDFHIGKRFINFLSRRPNYIFLSSFYY